jgi:pyruvate/2-oxoglutarate dehydrogenase complex dihydrolipoamide acyltransferase (E2) component
MTSQTITRDQLGATGTVEVTMPSPGIDVQVTVQAWLKRPGESVEDQEAICVVGWDAGNAELASPAAGVLRMVTVGAGQPVTIGSTLAVIDVALLPPAANRFARP